MSSNIFALYRFPVVLEFLDDACNSFLN